MLKQDFEQAIENVPDDASLWVDICDLAAKEFDAVGSAIISVETRSNGLWLTHSPILKAATEDYVSNGWWKRNYRMSLAGRLMMNKVVSDDDLGSRDQLRDKPFYKDFLTFHGLGYFIGGLLKVGSQTFSLSIQFPFDRKPASENEKQRMLKICAMIVEAAEQASLNASSKVNDYSGWIGESASDAFVLNPHSEVVQESAKNRFSVSDLLNALSESQLTQLKTVCASPVSERKSMSAELQVGERALQLLAFQLPKSLRHFHLPHKVVCIVRDATDRDLLLQQWLNERFSLTPAEIETALFMTKGLRPSEIAELKGLATATVSQRVKAIYAKMRLTNQLQLVAALNEKFR